MDTLAPPQLQQPYSSLPSLPTEIIHRIIKVALPRLSFATYTERYDVLLRFARVNALWAELAQMELVRHVRVVQRKGKTLEENLGSLPTQGAQRPVTTQSIWVTDSLGAPIQGGQVVACTSRMPRLRTLRVSSEHHAAGNLHFQTLSTSAQGMEEIVMDWAMLDPLPAGVAAHLPGLRRLALSCLLGPSAYASILTNAVLPQLEALILVIGHTLTSTERAELGQAVALHAPRLRSFGLSAMSDDGRHTFEQEVWSTFHGLEHLLIDIEADIPGILKALPSPLVYLRLHRPHKADMHSLQPMLSIIKTSPLSLSSVRRLSVGRPALQTGRGFAQRFAAEMKQLQAWGEEHGSTVGSRAFPEELCYHDGLEDVLNLWDQL